MDGGCHNVFANVTREVNIVTDYSVETRQYSETEWYDLLSQFDDATIYQSHAYGAVRWGQNNLRHTVVRKSGEIIGAAQAIIYTVPVIRAGLAYIPWGPLWRRKGLDASPDTLRGIVTSLKREYCDNQGLLLRMTPGIWQEAEADHAIGHIVAEGYVRSTDVQPYRTLMLDLTRESAEIRKRLDQKWRNQLNRAEKNGLEITEGTAYELYDVFLQLQKEMMDRKQYKTTIDYVQFGEIQKRLPESMKMHIIICMHEGKPMTATIGSAIGERGIYLLGATGEEGMKQKSAYLSQWKMIQWLQERNCRWYDLGGINPEQNPGVYHFKVGISSLDVRHVGQFEVGTSILSSLAVSLGEKIRSMV